MYTAHVYTALDADLQLASRLVFLAVLGGCCGLFLELVVTVLCVVYNASFSQMCFPVTSPYSWCSSCSKVSQGPLVLDCVSACWF